MKESIAAIRWVFRGLLIVTMLGASWLSYKFVTEPGYLAGLVMGKPEPLVLLPEGDQVTTGRLPQARSLPQAGGANLPANGRGTSSSGGNPAAGTTSAAGAYAPRTTATGSTRTVSRKKDPPLEAYAPPVAQRKVVRVGE